MTVYLLCFERPLKHARHYIGFTTSEQTLSARLDHHRAGTGSRLMAAVAAAGISFELARVWPDGSRDFERHLKNGKRAPQLCPRCTGRAALGRGQV